MDRATEGTRLTSVSIITATYHRPQALRHAIASVLGQTVRDWELIVVGDACTDDTAGVVAGFGDPRIRFVNLPRNCGEQSGPNNAGVALARGRHIAFLNHDDLWWPDHLEICLAALERTGADLVFANLLGIGAGNDQNLLLGDPRGRGFDPNQLVPASAWVGQAAAMREVGPWRPAHTLLGFPSQEWLFRAWWAGTDAHWSWRWPLRLYATRRRIAPTGKISVVHISSTLRPGMYRDPAAPEQERWARLIAEGTPRDLGLRPGPARRAAGVAERLQTALTRALLVVGVSPMATRMFLKHAGRRGRELAELRRRRGLSV